MTDDNTGSLIAYGILALSTAGLMLAALRSDTVIAKLDDLIIRGLAWLEACFGDDPDPDDLPRCDCYSCESWTVRDELAARRTHR